MHIYLSPGHIPPRLYIQQRIIPWTIKDKRTDISTSITLVLYDISNDVRPIKYNYNFHIYNLMSPSNFIKPHLSSEINWARNLFLTLNKPH